MAQSTTRPLKRVATATGLSVLGVAFSVLLSIPVFFVSLDLLTEFVVALVLSELGFVAAALVFLRATGRGWDYLNLGFLSRREVGFVVAGTVGLFVFRIVAILAAQALGLPLAGNSITQLAEEGVLATLLVLIPLSILVIGPAEELLFRGVVQPYLSESIPEWAAIVFASVLFALVHVPTSFVATPNPVAVGVTLTILFGLSILLGYLYVWSGNLLVPILVHGFYDALLFALAYLVLSSDDLSAVLASAMG
ncbi:CPBP family intramembrane glutamic endopeptidase [Halorussus amylolyticus]|uniref:CPBP family intramembrane glutamic endopeptidase n=1 Tax=Halorussus amylolyticus TaxID=1126242 RepID=UPI0010471D78|nr:type II CAAX endopeptidase family protein [Halorussus amylolyticus]